MSSYPIIYVQWADAVHPAGHWVGMDSVVAEQLPVIETAGFEIHRDEEKLVVASSYDGHDYVSGEMVIPVAMIKKYSVLTGVLDE